MTRAPPRFPRPAKAQRIFRTPPVSGMIVPASGFAPTNATSSSRSESDIIGFTSFRKRAVSTTVIGASAMSLYYTQFAYGEQDAVREAVPALSWRMCCKFGKWRLGGADVRPQIQFINKLFEVSG